MCHICIYDIYIGHHSNKIANVCIHTLIVVTLAWMEAIQEAGKEDFGEGNATTPMDPVRSSLSTYLQVLDMPTDVEPTEAALHRAYKSLTCNPDNGGDRKKVNEKRLQACINN